MDPMTQFKATPGQGGVFQQSFLQQLQTIHFPSGKSLLLVEVAQSGTGSVLASSTITGLPFASSVNIVPGGLVFGNNAIIEAKPTAKMLAGLVGWSTLYQQSVFGPGLPSQGIQPIFSGESFFMINLGLTVSKYPKWDRKFFLTMPQVHGQGPGTVGTQFTVVWCYINEMSPPPTGPFDPRIADHELANLTIGAWLALIRSDDPQLLSASEIVNQVKQDLQGTANFPVPVLDGSSTPAAYGAEITAAFATANVPVPPPFQEYIYVATTFDVPPSFPGETAATIAELGIFDKGQLNTYDQAFLGGSEGFAWYAPGVYGPHKPPEAVSPPISVVGLPPIGSFGTIPAVTKTFQVSRDLKTLTLAS